MESEFNVELRKFKCKVVLDGFKMEVLKMKIILNNRSEEFAGESLTISQIMEIKSFHFKMLVVRLNDTLIKRDEYASTQVKDGDDLKIIHLVSGG